jgi:hypothetical protein
LPVDAQREVEHFIAFKRAQQGQTGEAEDKE